MTFIPSYYSIFVQSWFGITIIWDCVFDNKLWM